MSLNQLPDELIAHVGTFLKDNTEFAKSQKRINRVLMRYGLNKPGCDTLKFYFDNVNSTINYIHDGIPDVIAPVNPDQLLYNFQEIINSTRFIKNLFIESIGIYDEDNMKAILQYLLATKVDIGTVRLNDQDIVSSVTADIFVALCKKFKCAPIADFFIWSMGFYKDEKYIEAESGVVKLDLGVLKRDQQFDVICWMNGINANTDNTYTIRNDGNEYMVVFKRWSVGQGNYIKFAVARKE